MWSLYTIQGKRDYFNKNKNNIEIVINHFMHLHSN